jgi:pSer/pThr/pTyr-binding forkhead associated (FHA) protein
LIRRSGRRFDADQIVLDAATASRYHALLLRHVDGLLVDLESTNGTFVNDIPIQPDEPVRLADGDVIQVGEVVACYAAVSALYEHS